MKGEDIAVVTDAGTPGISDPAQIIVQAAISAGIKICPLPGATALIPALSGSGLDIDCFTFYGFYLPKKTKGNPSSGKSAYPLTPQLSMNPPQN
jgi:16S rRNA (cytidine1402-2'-O)-methyltransferase